MLEVQAMLGIGERQREAIRPDFNRSIFIDFASAKITSDAGFLLIREVDQRFGTIESGCNYLVDERAATHKRHTFEQMAYNGHSGRIAFICFSVSRVMVTVWRQNFDRATYTQPMELSKSRQDY